MSALQENVGERGLSSEPGEDLLHAFLEINERAHGGSHERTHLTRTVLLSGRGASRSARGSAGPAVGNGAADIEQDECPAEVPARRANRDFGLVGFDHVDLFVKDRPRAQRFFVEQLGMEVIGEGPDHAFLLFGDQVLGLHDAKEGASLGGVDHLALRVAEWTGLRNRIGRARVTITGEKEREDSRSLFLRGPEGLKIELVWRPDPHVHSCSHGPAAPEPSPESEDEED